MNEAKLYSDPQSEKEADLFDEIVRLPKPVRKRLLDSVKAWEAVEDNIDLLVGQGGD